MGRLNKPEIIVAISAALWGLFWIPLRALESGGLSFSWVTVSQFIFPLLVMTPFCLYRVYKSQPTGLIQWSTGCLVGAAFVLYCGSLLLTDVVRALILFYVMPAWGTLIETLLMGRRFTVWRALALLLSIAGLVAILNLDSGVDLNLNLGDVMAFLSGVVFAFGAMKVREQPEVSVFEQLYAFFFYGSIMALILVSFPIIDSGTTPENGVIIKMLPWLLVMAVFFLIPVMWGIYWGSQQVDPGRLGILLQLEAIVGIASAALLAGEVFGVREAVGSVLVISAGLVEVFGNTSNRN